MAIQDGQETGPTIDPNWLPPGITDPGWLPPSPPGGGKGSLPGNEFVDNPVTNNQFKFPMGEDVKPYSGLPESYRDQLLAMIMPHLQQGMGDLPGNIDAFQQQAAGAYTPIDLQGIYGNIDESTQNALSSYQQQLQGYLKDMIPKDINQLANRGILSSSVAENMLSNTAARGARDASSRGYETLMNAAQQKANLGGQAAMQNAATQNQQRYNTAMQTALMKNNIPNTLGGLLQYGQSSQDPTVMYRTMAELLASL